MGTEQMISELVQEGNDEKAVRLTFALNIIRQSLSAACLDELSSDYQGLLMKRS
jgi:hypothetical protein